MNCLIKVFVQWRATRPPTYAVSREPSDLGQYQGYSSGLATSPALAGFSGIRLPREDRISCREHVPFLPASGSSHRLHLAKVMK
jgi:hypothetical protein